MAFQTNWEQVGKDTINGIERKLYRDLYTPKKTIIVDNTKDKEADLLAFEFLNSEQFASKILDTNKLIICDMLADLSKIPTIQIPVY